MSEASWEAFLDLIPDTGGDSPAARFLLDVLTELTENLEDLEFGTDPFAYAELGRMPKGGVCDLILATAESVMLR